MEGKTEDWTPPPYLSLSLFLQKSENRSESMDEIGDLRAPKGSFFMSSSLSDIPIQGWLIVSFIEFRSDPREYDLKRRLFKLAWNFVIA